MKKLFFPLFIILVLALALGVCAAEHNVEAVSAQDVVSAIDTSSDGDTVNVSLGADFTLDTSIRITKAITVNVDFNGYQISYMGTEGKSSSVAAFYLGNKGAALNLVGSNPLASANEYTHYGEDVKADMVGTGNLICVEKGAVNIQDAYFFATNDTFVVYVPIVKEQDCVVSAENSVLRTKEKSSVSAIAYRGGNYNNDSVVKKQLFLENCVEYGGFCDGGNSFNVTVGSEIKDVKFYDFVIVNDSWINTSAVYANSFEKSILFQRCSFKTYEEQSAPVYVQTETGKHNIKLWDCDFTTVENYGKFTGDSGGTAHVYIVTKVPDCVTDGEAYSYSSAKGNVNNKQMEEYRKDSFKLGKLGHREGEETAIYKNGYAKEGAGVVLCSLCGEYYETGNVFSPLAEYLGYSINQTKSSISVGVRIDHEAVNKFLAASKSQAFELGVMAGSKNFSITVEDGAVKIENGYISPIDYLKYDFFDLKITGFGEAQRDKEFAIEYYVYDGEAITFLKDDYTEARLVTFNGMVDELDEVNQRVSTLLESKHKLYYNDDGSFRVLVIADVHMSAWSDATKVQAAKDRIKMMVDRENPDLVIFTGDNTIGSSSADRLRQNIDAMAGYIEEKKIPWCHVYGNHDHENALSHYAQQEIYEEYEYCISKSTEGLSSVGNYVHGIYKKDGTLGGVIYLINSNTYDTVKGGYDYIKDDQIAWYKETSELLEKYNGGKAVKGIMAFHIPLIENNDAYNNRNNTDIVYEFTGNKNENICASATDTTLLETIFERGDIKAIVTGHDHVNDYMFNYKGVKLSSSPNISDLTYTNAGIQGCRVFDMALATIDDIPTYVSYVIERINPEKYGKLDANVTLESFDGEEPKTGVSGFDGGTLSGSMTVTVAEGNGKDGTNALEIKRSSTDNSEFYVYLSEDSYGKLGSNKYLVVWMDFTNVEFRKACVGLLSTEHVDSYRTDDDDGTSPPYYYLADGESQWQELKHGWDGCFGTGDGGGVKGKRGYFAFRIEDLLQGGRKMTENTLITGFYMYISTNGGYSNTPFYIDDIQLVEDYTAIK